MSLGVQADLNFQLSQNIKIFLTPSYDYNLSEGNTNEINHLGSSVGAQIGLKLKV